MRGAFIKEMLKPDEIVNPPQVSTLHAPPSLPQVGAAISMTYTTGQPIVFIGTGQRYTDIKSLNVHAVVSVLLK